MGTCGFLDDDNRLGLPNDDQVELGLFYQFKYHYR